MKKELAEFLSMDLQFIKGVGPMLAARFEELLGGRRILDFLLHIPHAVKSRPPVNTIMVVPVGEIITVPLTVDQIKKSTISRYSKRPTPTQVICRDGDNIPLTVQFFGSSFLDYWLEKLPIGETRMVSGKLEAVGSKFVITHPDFIEKIEAADKIPAFQAIYSGGTGLTQRIMSNVRDRIFENHIMADIPDFFTLLKKAHYPETNEDLSPMNETIRRLAYAELFASQLSIALSRQKRTEPTLYRRPSNQKISDYFNKVKFPFELTGAQKRTLDEVITDMNGSLPMMRLVQGDVGSGKTAIALMTILYAIDFGAQAVMLAPTDALAVQHFTSIMPILVAIGLHVEILTGRDKGKIRHEKLVAIKSGRTKLIVGTHALFSADVEYKNLGLAVIDEQHRFGVLQRAALAAKGNFVDILALSATPIPRTLAMTIYGDMDVSIVNEKPKGRLPIITTKLAINRYGSLIHRIQANMPTKVFWVVPLVSESETTDIMNAEKRHKELSAHFKAGLAHGQMDKARRDNVMDKFTNGDTEVLVATSVIEVGIDVPAATIMVIENAERFGMAALHQIRGRVGRGPSQSYCILLHGFGVSIEAEKRLNVLCETNDGFLIAEQDLMMRGTGEILGLKQSGWIDYHFVDYREHRTLFKFAIDKAKKATIANMITEEMQDLMWIFGKTEKMGLINS